MNFSVTKLGAPKDVEPMKLSKLLSGITVTTRDIEIRRIQYDSRKVQRGDLFVAMHGTEHDGHQFINDAIQNGAKAVIVEDDAVVSDSFFTHSGVMKIVVPNTRIAVAHLSANFYDHPSRRLAIVGVTGTNGKTTTSHLIKSVFEGHGNKTGLIGTIEYNLGDEIIPASHTTPESLELNSLLARMVENRCSAAVMEVSSHALHQHRVEGLQFKVAVFTNLTQDHLDYHGSMENYFDAKKILFDQLNQTSWAVVNVDDEWGKRIAASCAKNILPYGLSSFADVYAKEIKLSMSGTQFTIMYQGNLFDIQSPLIGRFNVYNLLAAFATGIALEVPVSTIQKAIRTTQAVNGRFEQIVSPHGWVAIIDYAHTPDALEKALKTIHDVFETTTRGRIITLFGCGGNRDRSKRPKMARIATELSDITVITSDNPRHENPEAIIDEVMSGVKPGSNVHREPDRKIAINKALDFAQRNDVVLIAGKGHEDYQVIGDQKIHLNDRETVQDFLRSHV
jgi:UDP-N-acetylmuramoyl-L-alanyl-D-glutamate--2,6-diaminopimelate ligase